MVQDPPKAEEDFSADAIADRVNCYDIADWLEILLARGQVVPALPSRLASGEYHTTSLAARGLSLTLYRSATDNTAHRDSVVLCQVTFTADSGAMFPFGLDARRLDPATACFLLSDDMTGGSEAELRSGDFRFSYFLNDARVVELTFDPSLVGISCCRVVRLGSEMPYSDIVARHSKRLGTL